MPFQPSSLPNLLPDLYALLAICSSQPIKCVGSFISRTALPHLASCLAAPPPPARWRTVRDCPAIHFLHALAHLAELVSRHPTTRTLQPTPFAQSWLERPPAQQLAHLQQAFANPANLQALWRTFQLPGHQLVHAGFTFSPLLDVCTTHSHHRPKSRRATATVAPLPRHASARHASARHASARHASARHASARHASARHASARQRLPSRAALVKAITVQAVQWATSATDAAVLADTFLALHQLLHAKPAPLRIRGDLTLIADPGKAGWQHPHAITLKLAPSLNPGQHHALSQWALLQNTTQHKATLQRHYLLSPSHLRRAWQMGRSLHSIRQELEQVTGDPLPAELVWQLRRWEQQWRQVRLYPATILEVSDTALLEQFTRSRSIRSCISRTLSPHAVVVRQGDMPALVRRMQRRGAQPSFSSTDLEDAASKPAASASASGFAQPDLAHAYVSALLLHHVTDWAHADLLRYRPPFAVVESLGHALSVEDRLLAQQLLADAKADYERAQQFGQATRLQPAMPITLAEESQRVAQLQIAIQNRTSRTITYCAANGQLSQRTLTPHRIEWHDAVPYLIAFCHLAQDERTFRIDRIQSLHATTQ